MVCNTTKLIYCAVLKGKPMGNFNTPLFLLLSDSDAAVFVANYSSKSFREECLDFIQGNTFLRKSYEDFDYINKCLNRTYKPGCFKRVGK